MLEVDRRSKRESIMNSIGPDESVGRLVSPAVAMVSPTATLRAAVDAMAADRLGLLVVADVKGPLGVISERDIVLAVADDLDLEEERVRDHCVTDIVSVDEATSVQEAARAMAAAEIRHLGVSRDGSLFGVISVRDVLRALTDA
jgi:CBS domain-containing protein